MQHQERQKALKVENLTVVYNSTRKAVDAVSFEATAGKILTLLGASGSGKTTILDAINATLGRTATVINGTIFLGKDDITHWPSKERGIGRVFQKYSLWDHMSVFENIAFPLRVRRFREKDIGYKVRSMLSLVKLDNETGIENRKPSQLSGGQQQRVALARAIVFNPQLLLLDEPLSSLDRNLRDEMQAEIVELQKKIGSTLVYVTHDQSEALSMSDKLAIVSDGRLIHVGSPMEIYTDPKHSYVASFLGDANFVRGKVTKVEGCQFTIQTNSGVQITSTPSQGISLGQNITVAIRPERITICQDDTNYENRFIGKVSKVVFIGGLIKFQVGLAPDLVVTGICLNKGDNLSTLKMLKEIKVGWHVFDSKIVTA
jgi:putative spermidine/putrescine transport system ATP-binding protein